MRICRLFDHHMNAVSIIVLALVVALCALALRSALRKGRGSCSCGSCSKKESCPYCDHAGTSCL